MVEVHKFTVAGKQGFVEIEFVEVPGFPDETSYLGGYDVKGKVEIKSGNYCVKDAELWFSTGQVYQFFVQLQNCYGNLEGNAAFPESENDLKMELSFNKFGQLTVRGTFQEFAHQENILDFEFESEQSYLVATLQQLQTIVGQYGDLAGKK